MDKEEIINKIQEADSPAEKSYLIERLPYDKAKKYLEDGVTKEMWEERYKSLDIEDIKVGEEYRLANYDEMREMGYTREEAQTVMIVWGSIVTVKKKKGVKLICEDSLYSPTYGMDIITYPKFIRKLDNQ